MLKPASVNTHTQYFIEYRVEGDDHRHRVYSSSELSIAQREFDELKLLGTSPRGGHARLFSASLIERVDTVTERAILTKGYFQGPVVGAFSGDAPVQFHPERNHPCLCSKDGEPVDSCVLSNTPTPVVLQNGYFCRLSNPQKVADLARETLRRNEKDRS